MRSPVDKVPIDRVLVVVPACDEELTVGACVSSVLEAAARCPVPVEVLVVADACRDATADVARAAGARVLLCEARRVGAARAAGVRAGTVTAGTWIASTDADSLVLPCWLEHQLDHAAAGADLVLGTVELMDTAGPGGNGGWRRRYAQGVDGSTHRHVHGANLGVRGDTCTAVGGFPDVPAHEDALLADAVAALPGTVVVTTVTCPVLTSDRRAGRAPAGVAHDLGEVAVRPRKGSQVTGVQTTGVQTTGVQITGGVAEDVTGSCRAQARC